MKILQLSDSHLGLQSYGLTERIRDMARPLDHIARLAIENQVDLVINAGDTFDRPEPDPYSVRAYRRFVDRLKQANIPLVESVGNHCRNNVIDKLGEGSWPTAIHDWIMCPDSLEAHEEFSVAGRRVIVANWMPREKLLPFLAATKQDPPDILVLHQMCGGFLPRAASNAEVSFDELYGAAAYIAIGDIHVWGVHTSSIPGDPVTTIVSSGPTEMTKIDESINKYVALVDLTTPVASVRQIQIPTRTQLIAEVRSDSELAQTRVEILRALENGDMPMVSIHHSSNMQRAIASLENEIRGKVLWRAVHDHVVDSSASYEAAKASANTEMPIILQEIINDNVELCDSAVSLWASPEHALSILAILKNSIRAKLNTL